MHELALVAVEVARTDGQTKPSLSLSRAPASQIERCRFTVRTQDACKKISNTHCHQQIESSDAAVATTL